jgi:hypothetical protein
MACKTRLSDYIILYSIPKQSELVGVDPENSTPLQMWNIHNYP